MTKKSFEPLFTDQPITNIISDKFGRRKLVKNTAEVITSFSNKEGEGSFVISVEGKWGEGKTSFINLLKEEIRYKYDENNLIIEFNPWFFHNEISLLPQFFRLISKKLHWTENCEFIKGIKKYLSYYRFGFRLISILCIIILWPIIMNAHRLPWEETKQLLESVWMKVVSTLILGYFFISLFTGKLSPIVAIRTLILSSGDVLTNIAHLLEQTNSKDQLIDLAEQRQEINKLIREYKRNYKKKLIIIIDDLDRLNSKEICQIFDLIKGIADFPHTIYILPFDPNIVQKALKEVHKDHPEKYLEKFIQFKLTLPVISSAALDKYVKESLGEIIQNEHQFSTTYHDQRYFINDYFTNLREAIRFLNIFRFKYSLLKDEVNCFDLIHLTAIESKKKKVFNKIKDNKNLFCIIPRSKDLEKYKPEYNNQRKNLNVWIKKNNSFKSQKLINSLFPTKDTFEDGTYAIMRIRHEHETDNRKKNRIYDYKHFDIYFKLSPTETQISFEEFQEILSVQENQHKLNDKIIELSSTARFMDLKRKFNDSINVTNFFIALTVVAEKCEMLATQYCLPLSTELNNIRYNKVRAKAVKDGINDDEVVFKNSNDFQIMLKSVKHSTLLQVLSNDKDFTTYKEILEQRIAEL